MIMMIMIIMIILIIMMIGASGPPLALHGRRARGLGSLRGRRDTVEIVWFEISKSTKPYTLFSRIYQ